MIRSMTGYGRAAATINRKRISLEMSAVNNRFLELSVRLPKAFSEYESEIRETITALVARGKITLTVTIDDNNISPQTLILNEESAALYYKMFTDLKRRFKLAGDISVSDFTGLPELFNVATAAPLPKKEVEKLIDGVRRTVAAFNRTREREGKALGADMANRIALISKALGKIEKLQPLSLERYRARLLETMEKLRANSAHLAAGDELRIRIDMELAILVDKTDITEECVRLYSHCDAFNAAIKAPGDSGKRLNFILQEMNREANTIGSKASLYEITAEVIKIREEIERLREQVQNIE